MAEGDDAKGDDAKGDDGGDKDKKDGDDGDDKDDKEEKKGFCESDALLPMSHASLFCSLTHADYCLIFYA